MIDFAPKYIKNITDKNFIPLNRKSTFGQMFKSKKIKMDHRFIAFQKLKKKIKI